MSPLGQNHHQAFRGNVDLNRCNAGPHALQAAARLPTQLLMQNGKWGLR